MFMFTGERRGDRERLGSLLDLPVRRECGESLDLGDKLLLLLLIVSIRLFNGLPLLLLLYTGVIGLLYPHPLD
jgi:hypothetical protein